MASERIPQGGGLAKYDAFQAAVNQARAGMGLPGIGPIGPGLRDGLGAASKEATRLAGKYGPLISTGVKRGAPIVGAGLSLLQGDVGGAIGSGIGGVLGAGLGPLGAIAGTTLGGMLGSGVQNAIAGGIEGGQARQRERGESTTLTGLGEGKEVGDLEGLLKYAKESGMDQVEIAGLMNEILQGNKDADVNRQMQLNQQLGQLTGGLNKQKYMAQIAANAQAEGAATTRSILSTENPYAASVFKYGG